MKKLIFILLVLTSCHSQKKAQRLPYCMTAHRLKNLVDSNGHWIIGTGGAVVDTIGERIWVQTNTVIFDGGYRIGSVSVEALNNAIYSISLSSKDAKFYNKVWVHSNNITEHTSYVLEENFFGSIIVDTVKEIRNVSVFKSLNGHFNINLHDKIIGGINSGHYSDYPNDSNRLPPFNK